jgi:hypothetical protein
MLNLATKNRRPEFMNQAGRNRKRLYFEIDFKEMRNNDFYTHYRFGRWISRPSSRFNLFLNHSYCSVNR